MKKVSVIVPVYNGEKYIEQTILQILQSTYSNLELIIINDGSMDNSLHICKKIRNRDKRIFVYSKDNEGVAAARNYGISKTTGDYICFCDQDDIVETETYARQVASINEYQSDFCMCSTGRSIEGKKSGYEYSEDAYYEGNQVLEELLYPLLFNGYNVPIKMNANNRYPHIWNCMFCREFIEKYNISFRAFINYEDDLLMKVKALSKAKKVSTLAYTGYYWRVNLKSETYAHKYVDNIGEKQQKCYEYMLCCLAECVDDEKILDLFKQVTFCKQYMEAVHNLSSPFIKKKFSIMKDYYRREIYARDLEYCIQAVKYIKKGRVKPNIILPMLSKKMTILCCLTEGLLDTILRITLHSQLLTKIERGLKQI